MKKILIITLLITGSAFADYRLEDAPDMIAQKIETEVADTTEALKTVDTKQVLEQSWVASRIRLLLKPFAAFDAKLLEIKVAPMIEFRWERKPPKGWVNYKPASDPETNGH
jgi:hypothetical protein